MDQSDFEQKIAVFCDRIFDSSGQFSDLRHLSGGASMESWSFCCGDEEFVLRRLPSGISPDDEGLCGISLAIQADIIDIAVQSGVTAPTVRGRLAPEDSVGEGFIMDKAEGETLPHKILGNSEFAEAESKLTDQCARELWNIHNIDPDNLPDVLEYFTPLELITLQKDKYEEIGGAILIYEYAFHWLKENAPAGGAKNSCTAIFAWAT